MITGTKAITSLQNGRVKAIRALEMRKARKETGLFVAEGAKVIVNYYRGAEDAARFMRLDRGWSVEMTETLWEAER